MEEFQKENVDIIALSVDPLEKAKETVEQHNVTFPVAYGLQVPEDAEKILSENFVFYGAIMTRMGMADGFVAGASHTTTDVARAAIP